MDPEIPPNTLVRDSYNRAAQRYAADRDQFHNLPYLERRQRRYG